MHTCALGERLREERERLGLNQEELGQIGGVNRNTQGKYEKGERSPDAAYMAALSAAGVDMLYVVTGTRSPVAADSQTNDEAQLLASYRKLQEDDRTNIRQLITSLEALSSKLRRK